MVPAFYLNSLKSDNSSKMCQKILNIVKGSKRLYRRMWHGCMSFVHVHSQTRGNSTHGLSDAYLLVTFLKIDCKCYHIRTKKFYVYIEVTFVENEHFITSPQKAYYSWKRRTIHVLCLNFQSFHTSIVSYTLTLPESKSPTLPESKSFTFCLSKSTSTLNHKSW